MAPAVEQTEDLETEGSITYLKNIVQDGFKQEFDSILTDLEAESILSIFVMNVAIGLTKSNQFQDLIATVHSCSIITMAYLKKRNKAIYNRYCEDDLPHPLPFIVESKDWNKNDNDTTQPLRISIHVKRAFDDFAPRMTRYNSNKYSNFCRNMCEWPLIRRRIKMYVELYQCITENSKLMDEEASDCVNSTLQKHFEEVSAKLRERSPNNKEPCIFKTGALMLLSLKRRARMIDQENTACDDDAEHLGEYIKNKEDHPTTSNETNTNNNNDDNNHDTVDNNDNDNNDTYDIDQYMNDDIEEEENEESGLLYVPDNINELLPVPLQQRKTKARLAKEAKEELLAKKRRKKKRGAGPNLATVQQRATKNKAKRQRALDKRQEFLPHQTEETKQNQDDDSESEVDLMEYNWKDQPPFKTFVDSTEVFILPNETYHRGEEHLILAAETYIDEEGNVVPGPSGGGFLISHENQSGPVQLAETEGVAVKDTWYVAAMENLHVRSHTMTTSSKWKNLEDQNRDMYFPIQVNAISKRNLHPKNEEEKKGFGTLMIGPSSKEYNNHKVFQQLRYNIPKIFDTMLEIHKDKDKWDNTRNSCILHLGFSGGTNQQSEALTRALDPTAITAKPEMNGKQDGSLEEFHRMIGPILSLLSNTASTYLRTPDGSPVLNNPYLEEEFAKVFGEACGCPTETNDDLKNLFHALSTVLQEVGVLVTLNGEELDMDDNDIEIEFVREHCKVRFNFGEMTKHLDGKNMKIIGFLHTLMFSVLLVKGRKVYRLTNIAYTRDICYRWIMKNRVLFSKISELYDKYLNEMNGGQTWFDLTIQQDMNIFLKRLKGPQSHQGGHFAITKETASTIERFPAVWSPTQYENALTSTKLKCIIKTISFRELTCRSALDSPRAWMINKLQQKFGLRRRNVMELVWAGTIATSTIAFVSILTFWFNENRCGDLEDECDSSHNATTTNFSWNDDNVNLMYEYWRTSRYLKLKLLGGPEPRWTSQGDQMWPIFPAKQNTTDYTELMTLEQYNKNLQKMETCISQLENGTLPNIMFEPGGKRTGLPIPGMGKVNSISFAPLCLFTGLATSDSKEAIEFACYAGSNTVHTKTFWNDLLSQNVVNGEEPTPAVWKKVTTAVGNVKCAQRQTDIEQTFCARYRTIDRADVLFYGQDMYIIQNGVPLIKKWNTTEWVRLPDISIQLHI